MCAMQVVTDVINTTHNIQYTAGVQYLCVQVTPWLVRNKVTVGLFLL